jgi:TonB-dependent starch-binding outer membrane protein SusC
MKKINELFGDEKIPELKKFLRLMKLTVFFILISVGCVLAGKTYSQTKTLTLHMENSTVKEVLKEIESQSEFRIMYSGKFVDVDREVSLDVKNQKIESVLNTLFAGTDVGYTVKDRFIVLITPELMVEGTLAVMQQRAVSGKVTDSGGQSLPGVTVVVKGTTQGTVTNADGEYSLTNIPEDATLVFSFVGMRTQEIVVGNQDNINVAMEEETIGIEEVVAIGYGTMRKSDLTGSVERVNVDEMRELSNVSVMQAMQGSVAGLNVGAVEKAGEEPDISIRGQNTLSSSAGANSPLIVVDGAIYRGRIIDLNPADIESVDILKDASSTAIYGSQAANGVMIITTKKGEIIGKPVINYDASYTVDVDPRKIVPMQAEEYEDYYKDVFWAEGARLGPDYLQPNPDFNLSSNLKTDHIVRGYERELDYPWYDTFTGNGYKNSHNLSIRGKNNQISYFFSGGFTDVKGLLKNDEYKRYSYRINLDAEITNWLTVGIQSFLTQSDFSGAEPNLEDLFIYQPWVPATDENGEYIPRPEGLSLNPFLQIQQNNSDKSLNIFGNLYAEIQLPLKGLDYKINFSQNYRTSNEDNFDPFGASEQGLGYKNSHINYDYTVDNILTYNNTFNDVHKINATLIYGVEKRQFSYTNSQAQNFANDLLGYNRLQAGDPTLFQVNSGAEQEQSLYSMARILYNFNNRYLVTGTVRRDGFSGFGGNEKTGYFPSIALGWVASQEDFFKENLEWFDYLKIRGSYGRSGRRGVGRYDTKAVVASAPYYIFGDGGSAQVGQWLSSLPNDELGWETTTGINVGLDFNIFNSLLYGNMEYYNNKTEDILFAIQLPEMTGFSSINTNIGEVGNHGLEFTLNSQIFKTSDLTWDSGINFTRNRNKIVSILGFDNDGDGIEDDLVANQLFMGEPTDVVYDYEIERIWQFADKETGEIPIGFDVGQYKIADLNRDGEYSATDDRKILGYRDPSYRLGISNTITYEQFRLYAFINSIQGGKDYYYGEDIHPFNNVTETRLNYQNVPRGGWDYWMPENPDARFERLDFPSTYKPSRYLQRNFIRIQDVSLSYSIDQKSLSKINIQSLRIFVSGKNLATFTKWRGHDPETGVGFGVGLPVMRSYSVGLNVEL